MQWGVSIVLAGAFGVQAAAQIIDVGTGSPNSAVAAAFYVAYQRNGFGALVGPPWGVVTQYGSTGYIQRFPSISNSSATLALIKPDATASLNVQQVLAGMFAFYASVGVATAGYPVTDTVTCPALHIAGNSCQWQQFTNNYALFTYASAVQSGGAQNFATRDPYFTLWNNLGGVSGLGPANSVEMQLTSIFNSQATAQTFDQGAIYNITSGLYSGRLLAVKEPVYDLYVSNGRHTGALGFPTSIELMLANGMVQQSFEGGAIQYDPVTRVAVLRPPVVRVVLTPAGPLRFLVGDTAPAQVTLYLSDGSVTSDRTVAWNTSNGRVVTIRPNGLSATLVAVGPGTATVNATAEGKTSTSITITVTAPCCQIGEGAPTLALQQAFQDAVARNKLTVQLPAASAAVRIGNGYVQQLTSTGANPVSYLVAVPDSSVTGYVVAGALLTKYQSLGGPTGALGYPVSDATPGGRQTFQQGTLAASPVQVVTGAILTKWGTLGLETGLAGSPTDAASPFQTFRGTTGVTQPFQNALLIAANGVPAYAVSSPVLAKYLGAGGVTGDLGAPTNDEHTAGALRQQDFEGGYINYFPGAATVNLTLQPRLPIVTATPGVVLSGTPVHLVAGGFKNGAAVRVSQSGQPDFTVTVSSGSYAWDVLVPASAASATVSVIATDTSSSAITARATYTVRNAASAPLAISVLSGDGQNGAPAAQLAQPIVVVVKDQNGDAVSGQIVTWMASPGAQVAPISSITDANGKARATVRLPAAEGVVLGTAQAGHSVVTFSAKSAAFSLSNFPALSQGSLGALVTAVASILRYHQLRNELPQPNGLADATTLDQFLKQYCATDAQGNKLCDGYVRQTPNLWRVGMFAGGGIEVRTEQVDLNGIRDLVAAGSPVLLSLSLKNSGAAFVVATGIASNGDVAIVDPAGAQSRLGGYLAQGMLVGASRLLPQAPAVPGFLLTADSAISLASVSGACGATLPLPPLYFRWCDGAALGPYQADLSSGGTGGTLTDLSPGGGQSPIGASSVEVVRIGSQWTLASLSLSFTTAGVVNAASFTGDIAPGGLISIFGAGLTGGTVTINGKSAPTLITTPFQINAQIPADTPAGSATLQVSSSQGTAQQSISLRAVAPAIFLIGASQAAITNQDNTLNTPSNPALRGSGALVIYSTGFGAAAPSGKLNVASTPVSAVIGGVEIAAAFAGLTPGFIGLYQANILIPANLPPGLNLPLYLKQGGATSNTVSVAIQ